MDAELEKEKEERAEHVALITNACNTSEQALVARNTALVELRETRAAFDAFKNTSAREKAELEENFKKELAEKGDELKRLYTRLEALKKKVRLL